MSPPVDGCAVILAAGRGVRMGGPKALMHVGGTPWWRVQAARLAEAGVPAVWVVSPEVFKAIATSTDDLAPSIVQIAAMGDPDAPMFASVLAGIDAARARPESAAASGLFVLPVDVPVPGRAVWAALANPKDVRVPTHRGIRGHPVFLPWPWIHARVLAGPVAQNAARRLDELIADAATMVEVDDPVVATNMNTPADLERWSRAAFDRPGGAAP